MHDFTFLTEDQIFGKNKLDILKKYGTKCAITDFSILLGGYVSSADYINKSKLLIDRTGIWWTKNILMKDETLVVRADGYKVPEFPTSRFIGARPSVSFSSIDDNCSCFSLTKNGIEIVEYGEYPQDVVIQAFAKILEKEYKKGTLYKTGKIYTTDSGNTDKDEPFKAMNYIEYEYAGNKYIRCIAKNDCEGETLHDGRIVRLGEPYWVEVQPIKWLVDEQTDIALSEKIIFSGVRFNALGQTNLFDTSEIKKFMDNYFSKDIVSNLEEENDLEEEPQVEVKIEKYKKSNPYGFDFEKVSEEDIIKGAIESGIAVFLHGKSSEGKSARVKQIDPDCLIIYLRNATPESLNGKSVYNSETGEMIDIKPTWLKKLEDKCTNEPDKYHIVFFDEITNALPSIQGIAFNIVLDREVNGIWQLPENARIVAAGNDMKDSLAANQLAEPLFNRFAHVYIQTTVEKWLKWASEHNIHPAIYSYIAYKKEEVLRSKYDGEKPNADPRKWEMASKMLYATGQPEMLRALIGEDITNEFCQFCNQRVITLEDVLNENYTERDLQMNTSEMYATAMGLSQVDEANFEKVREFVLKLGGEPCALFDSLWIHGDEARMEIVAEARLINLNEERQLNKRKIVGATMVVEPKIENQKIRSRKRSL